MSFFSVKIMSKGLVGQLEKQLRIVRSVVDVPENIWQPMEEFYRNHFFRNSKIIGKTIESTRSVALISAWREEPRIPLALTVYRIGTLHPDLYVEAFLQVVSPNRSTSIAFDQQGQLHFDRQGDILGENSTYNGHVLTSQQNVEFLGLLPGFQKELLGYIGKYRTK